MKISECWKGRVVQSKYCSYEEAIELNRFGHIERFHKIRNHIYVEVKTTDNYSSISLPEDLIPLQD